MFSNQQNQSMLSFQFRQIGFIESPLKDKFAIPRQPGLVSSLVSTIHLDSHLSPELALEGLEGFSHLWIFWVFHSNQNKEYHPKIHPPRLEGESIGVFATRSPHRPNPIGLSLVEIVKIQNGQIQVRGADLQNGTPIIDLKPYLPEIEVKLDAQMGWVQGRKRPKIEVEFAPEVLANLALLQNRHPDVHISDLIKELISLDPRPEIYRGEGERNSWSRHPRHAFRLYEGDIHFRMLTNSTALVDRIEDQINWQQKDLKSLPQS